MKLARRVTHVIFDMDGVLLDTEPLYTQTTQAIVQRFGKDFSWDIKADMIGRAALDSARYLVDALELPISAEQYLEERTVLLAPLFPGSPEIRGAEAFTRALHAQGVPMAVATSSEASLYRLKTESRHRVWFEIFSAVVTGDDPSVRRSKPAPDIFNEAARRIGAKTRVLPGVRRLTGRSERGDRRWHAGGGRARSGNGRRQAQRRQRHDRRLSGAQRRRLRPAALVIRGFSRNSGPHTPMLHCTAHLVDSKTPPWVVLAWLLPSVE